MFITNISPSLLFPKSLLIFPKGLNSIKCQLTKYQMCLGCKACESVCKHDAISVKDDGTGKVIYNIDDKKCVRCTECVGHYNAGCYMRKVLMIKRGN